MAKYRIFTLVILALVVCFSTLYAVPAYPYPIKITQPDGSVITIILKGDEYFKYKTTVDGYLLTPNSHGVLTYAELNAEGVLVSTKVKASDVDQRTTIEKETLKRLTPNQPMKQANIARRKARIAGIQSSTQQRNNFPITGSPSSLVILVNFAGATEKFVTPTPQSAFSKLLNQSGYAENGGTGSARDYFMNNSSNVFSPTFDVVGPFTLPHNISFYGTNDNVGDDQNPQQMVIDACQLANLNGVDFSKYDVDNDGFVDNVFVYYAGYNEAENAPDNTIWPHRWSLPDYSTKFNGKIVYDYACTSELKGNAGSTMCGIGTFCHEFGHVLGLPDYYATNDASHQTLSYWSIMDSGPYLNGGKTPPAYSAYDRFFLNWLVPTEINTPGSFMLEPLTNSNKAYIITQFGNHNLNGQSPSPTEFFTLENRQKIGWDTYLPGHGMLITRINYNANDWADNTPNNNAALMGVDIIEADKYASDANLSGDPFPGTAGVTSYSAILRNGTDIFRKLIDISEDGIGNILFKMVFSNLTPTITTDINPHSFATVQGTPSDSIIIVVNGNRLESNINISFEANSHFEMKNQLEPNSNWSKTLSLHANNGSVLNNKVMIRYNPTAPSFENTHVDELILNSTNATQVKVRLYGNSTRRVYIVPPVAKKATEITIGSFMANWDLVSDSIDKNASGYYFTCYSILDGTSELKQGFANGLKAPIGWTINASAATTSISYSGESIPAIQLMQSGELIITETYLLPVKNLLFYIRSAGENSGSILLEGRIGAEWESIDNIAINSTLKTVKNYSLNKNYIQFRFTFNKGVGDVIIDDITARFAKKLEYLEHEKWCELPSYTVMNLDSNKEYFYVVRASDKTLKINKTLKYENITDFSNIITVKTLEDKVGNVVRVRAVDGTLITMLPTTNLIIRIYNLMGQLVKELKPNSTIFEINDLPRGQIFILEAGKNRAKFMIP